MAQSRRSQEGVSWYLGWTDDFGMYATFASEPVGPNNDSSSLPSCCSSVLAASMPAMASLESPPTTSSAEEGLSGSLPSLCNYSGLCLLAHGYCGRYAISRTFIHGLGKQDSPSLLGKRACYITPFTMLTISIAFREPHFGLPLPTRTGDQSKVSTSFLRQPDG